MLKGLRFHLFIYGVTVRAWSPAQEGGRDSGLTLRLRPLASLLVGRRETLKEPLSDFLHGFWFGFRLDHSNCNKQAQDVTHRNLSVGKSGIGDSKVWLGL